MIGNNICFLRSYFQSHSSGEPSKDCKKKWNETDILEGLQQLEIYFHGIFCDTYTHLQSQSIPIMGYLFLHDFFNEFFFLSC